MSADVRAHVRQLSSRSHQEHASRIVDRIVICCGIIKDLHKHFRDLLGVAPFTSPARLQDGGWCRSRAVPSRKNVVLERGFPVSRLVPADLRFP